MTTIVQAPGLVERSFPALMLPRLQIRKPCRISRQPPLSITPATTSTNGLLCAEPLAMYPAMYVGRRACARYSMYGHLRR